MDWELTFSKRAQKDSERLKSANLHVKAKMLLETIKTDPYVTPPPCEKLIAELAGAFSRRINLQHRLVYRVQQATKKIEVISMFAHYE